MLIVVFSTSYSLLFVGRVVEGTGAVLSVLAINDRRLLHRKTRYCAGGIGVIIAVLYAVGPLMAGFLVTHDWKWIFVINVPVVAIRVPWDSSFYPQVKSLRDSVDLTGKAGMF